MVETTEEVASGENAPPKTAKQLEKEAKKLAKLEKFKQKQDKKDKTVNSNVKPKEKAENDKKKPSKDTATYEVATAPGEKKDTTIPMPAAYSPQFVEAAWYSWWEKEGFFKPEYNRKSISDPNPNGKFVMVLPPPNVTGYLHLGHALTNAVEDAITRYNRMKGRTTLWNPGCDHAGIATQVVVEKKLWREEQKTRHDLGREKFLEKIWEWKNEKGDVIYDQLRALGGSFDWDRAAFTMDPKLSRAVTEAFVRLHDEGVIYRSNRLVNWSCTLKSAISDIEVEKTELSGKTMLSIPGYTSKIEFGVLVHFNYKILDEETTITVATTRPETMLGDSAIAVHPEDARYTHLVGKFAQHPFCDRKIPVIADAFVDKEFGTGAVKITPAHDPNDYEVGKRQNLPFITIFNDEGIIIGDYGEFTGMKRFDARRKILKALEELKLLVEVKDHTMVVPICSRSKDVVEPMIKPQWYIRCDEMAAEAVDAVKRGDLKIIPEQHKKTWYHWMEGIRDWCISRQLWWGHRIPAYRVSSGKKVETPGEEVWVSARSESEARTKAAAKLGVAEAEITLEQDPDVLDTWFSSALFPFSIFGWPDETEELKAFYPGTLLETGHDILFFWVARMVFFGQKLMGKLPFKEVYLHAMVRDAHGRKMSKSLGNVIDPVDVIKGVTLEKLHQQLQDSNLDPRELAKAIAGQKRDFPQGIPECGTDALRFAVCAYTSQGRDINLDILRVQGYRFFCNKLWNATKFALRYLEDFQWDGAHESIGLTYGDEWLLKTLREDCVLESVNEFLAEHPYLDGFTPSQADARVSKIFSRLGDVNLSRLNHLKRWRDHLSSFTTSEKTKFRSDRATILSRCTSNISNGFQLTGHESKVDLWMLSRLSYAAKSCDEGLEQYDFNGTTTTCYSLWLYDLCDTYLEYLKPVFQSGMPEQIVAAKRVLFTTLDVGLRLLSPFMPFITEELYQRLPRAQLPYPSICVSSYPTQAECPWRNEAIEAEVEIIYKVIRSIRSTLSSYNVVKRTTEVFFRCKTEQLSSMLNEYQLFISTLSHTNVTSEALVTHDYIMTNVSDQIQAYILLKGVIDPQKELERFGTQKEALISTISKLKQAMDAHDYKAKVPSEVQVSNLEKLVSSEGELARIIEAIDGLKLIL